MGTALQRLVAEDPTLTVKTDEETGQTILAGMGELHLDIIIDRMRREFKVEATTGKPQIAYRETIIGNAGGEGKFVRQSGGKGQYGHVVITMEPNEKGKGIEVINKIVGGVIPKEFIKPTTDGLMEACSNGVVAGYPVVDVKMTITDGSFHPVDSSEIAFKMAGIFAFKDAMKKADPILLEPIMGVEITTPEEFQGDLIGDINRRRGRVNGMQSKAGAATCHSKCSSATSPISGPFPRVGPAPPSLLLTLSRSQLRSSPKLLSPPRRLLPALNPTSFFIPPCKANAFVSNSKASITA